MHSYFNYIKCWTRWIHKVYGNDMQINPFRGVLNCGGRYPEWWKSLPFWLQGLSALSIVFILRLFPPDPDGIAEKRKRKAVNISNFFNDTSLPTPIKGRSTSEPFIMIVTVSNLACFLGICRREWCRYGWPAQHDCARSPHNEGHTEKQWVLF